MIFLKMEAPSLYYCPNPKCAHHIKGQSQNDAKEGGGAHHLIASHARERIEFASQKKFYQCVGSFKTRWNQERVERYRCKSCGKHFSASTFKKIYRQHKPQLNQPIFALYNSGMTQRRLAKHLKTSAKTVAAKFQFLALLAREAHETFLKSGKYETGHAQFDEMQSFEHSRLKPLSIALAVTAEKPRNDNASVGQPIKQASVGQPIKQASVGQLIIEASVAQISYRGKLAEVAKKKYGERRDESYKARAQVLAAVKRVAAKEGITLTTDAKSAYRTEIKKVFGSEEDSGCAVTYRHEAVPNRKNLQLHASHPTRRRNFHDRMFWLNHICARIRHDLSRMMRKVWTTTKKLGFLQAHLDLYIAYYNGYELGI